MTLLLAPNGDDGDDGGGGDEGGAVSSLLIPLGSRMGWKGLGVLGTPWAVANGSLCFYRVRQKAVPKLCHLR